jgi:hypothetical protein
MNREMKQPQTGSLADNALGRRILIQRSNLAGFRHHQACDVWPALRRDAFLTLERDTENTHDPDAVAICWRGRKLGYLPRGENFLAARLLERERRLSARVEGLRARALPNRRIRIAVLMH